MFLAVASANHLVNENDIDFTIRPGELHALSVKTGPEIHFREMIMGFGLIPASLTGQGQPVQITNPQQARAMGIGMVFSL